MSHTRRVTFRTGAMALLVLAWAWPTLTASADSAEPKRRGCDFQGVIERVDRDARTLIVRTGRKPAYERRSVRYDEQTAFVRSRRDVSADELRPHLRVWVYLRDGAGKPNDLAARLTLADPYPDIYGVVTAVDVKAGVIELARRYPESGAKDRRQAIRVRADAGTLIRCEGREMKLADVPIGRRVAVTSVRNDAGEPTGVAAKVTVYRPSKKSPRSPDDDAADDDAETES